MKVSHDEIARRFNCGESSVSKTATARKSIEEESREPRNASSKATRTGLFSVKDNPFDDEDLSDIDDGDESAQHERKDIVPPPAYAELSDFFGPSEKFAQSCGNAEVGHVLRKTRISILAVYASTKTR